MAQVFPFAALRYVTEKVGPLESVITQPYDKITPEMLARYQRLSPYNLAHVLKTADYAGAGARLKSWLAEGALRPDPAPAIYPYFQRYSVPGSDQVLTRKGFVAAGRLEEYRAGVVYRHEQTLSGPKQDRLDLLRSTRAHFGQLFMLYSDPAGEVERLLDTATAAEPLTRLSDEYGGEHIVWREERPAAIEAIQRAMADKKLLIADGHHRYETALAFREECRRSPEHRSGGRCEAVMMTLVNMEAPGLTILPTHRLLARLPGLDRAALLESVGRYFESLPMSPEEGRRRLATYGAGQALGLALTGVGGPDFFLLRLRSETDLAILLAELSPAQRGLDVVVLHSLLLARCLGINERAVREQKFLEYVREFEVGLKAVADGAAACFFLNPVRIEQMREIAFSGGVLPQKSTDFYPKLLSGLTIYRVPD